MPGSCHVGKRGEADSKPEQDRQMLLKFPRSEDASTEGTLENKHSDHLCLGVIDVYGESDSFQWTLKAEGCSVSLETSCVHNPDTC